MTNIQTVRDYILGQTEHHAKFSFAQEMKKYLSAIGRDDIWEEWFRE